MAKIDLFATKSPEQVKAVEVDGPTTPWVADHKERFKMKLEHKVKVSQPIFSKTNLPEVRSGEDRLKSSEPGVKFIAPGK